MPQMDAEDSGERSYDAALINPVVEMFTFPVFKLSKHSNVTVNKVIFHVRINCG